MHVSLATVLLRAWIMWFLTGIAGLFMEPLLGLNRRWMWKWRNSSPSYLTSALIKLTVVFAYFGFLLLLTRPLLGVVAGFLLSLFGSY